MESFTSMSSPAQGAISRARASVDLSTPKAFVVLLSLALVPLLVHVLLSETVTKRLAGLKDWAPKWRGEAGDQKRKPQGPALDFLGTFPPPAKEAIISRKDDSALEVQKALSLSIPDAKTLQKSQLPSTRQQDFLKDGQYTPTGFSTAELRALGTFPDYSVLSGVPHPKPCPSFDIKTAHFRPFRPFRWGYHQTMSLMKFEPDFWLELEHNYFDRLKQRRALYDQYGDSILNYAPGSELACRELMEMVLQFLCNRYPHYFYLSQSNTVFNNRLLGISTDLKSTHPLHVLFEHVPEDFAIMLRNESDGMYYLRAGFICSSIGWTFGTHFNRQLRAIHTEVNDYEEKMSKPMDRFFSKLPVNKPIQRGSWFIEDWEPLFVTPEEYKANGGTRHKGEKITIEQCNLRVDWQTLRRLPLSGAIVFNFKAIFTPMTELRTEPYIPSVLYKQITEGKASLTEAKVHDHIRPTVLEALQKWKNEQVKDGKIVPDWQEETLAESPYFPGWEECWRAKLGFTM